MWNVWCREVFGDAQMECEDPFCRQHERALRMALFQHEVGDDAIQEPWLTVRAAVDGEWEQLWGVREGREPSAMEGGAWKFAPPLKTWDDMERLRPTPHRIDEEATAEAVARLQEAVGDILPIDVVRAPAYWGFSADISTDIAKLRGLEQLMIDMYESPDELHRLLRFMCDGIRAAHDAAEAAGDFGLTCHSNQAMPYAEGLPAPAPNQHGRPRGDLWGFCAAQEYTLISPAFHEEFLFQYQREIIAPFGLTHYGCCEDLTQKIDMLRQLENLRAIAVTPTANVARCAEQIGSDYAISWRPNPTDMVCAGWNEERIRRIIGAGLDACRGQSLHIHLKDVETVQGDPDRLRRWVALVRETADQIWG